MLQDPDRRSQDRRTDSRVSEPLERKAPRRLGERRESSRPFRTLFVHSSIAPLPVLHRASLSLSGARWVTEVAPEEDAVVLELKLPDMVSAAKIPGRIERRKTLTDGKIEVYARFGSLDLPTELALARYIEGRARLASPD